MSQQPSNSMRSRTTAYLLASKALLLVLTLNPGRVSPRPAGIENLSMQSNTQSYLKQQQAFDAADGSIPSSGPHAATAQEWVERFACKRGHDHPNANRSAYLSSFRVPLSNIGYHLMDECNRDKHAWRFRYVDELQPSFTLQVRDRSIDERLANILYSLDMDNMLDTSYFAFGSGEPREDERNELRVAGSRVNEAQCSLDLDQMASTFDEMGRRLAEFRSSSDPVSHNMTLEERHIRMARVLDSFGRYESGALEGRQRFAGNYGQCIGSQLTSAEWDQTEGRRGDKIQMRYCWANLNFDKHLQPMLRHRQRLPHETGATLLNMGVCLPQSCHSKSFHSPRSREIVQRLVDSQLRLPDSIYIEHTFDLESVFCLVDADSEWGRLPASGKLCLVFVCCWALLCIGVTLTNTRTNSQEVMSNKPKDQDTAAMQKQDQQQRGQAGGNATALARFANYFDLASSWREFTSDRRELEASEPIDLNVLNPIKFGICIFSIAGHTSFMLGSTSVGIAAVAAYTDSSILLPAALMSSVVIDSFFVMSGILVTYIALKRVSRYQQRQNTLVLWYETCPVGSGQDSGQIMRRSGSHPINNKNSSTQHADLGGGASLVESLLSKTQAFLCQWFALASIRYFRLVPLYALMFWFRRDVLPYSGSGPLWDHGLNRNTTNGACSQEPWYMPFTFMSAFVPLSRQCFAPAWSIGNDMLFGLLVPPVILGFLHRPRLTIISVVVISVISLVSAVDAFAYAHPASVWELLDAKLQGAVLLFNDLSHIYTLPFYRVASFLIGSLSGYFLFKYEQEHAHCFRQNTNLGVASRLDGESIFNTAQANTLSFQTTNLEKAQADFKGWPAWFRGPALRSAYIYLGLYFLSIAFANDLKHLLDPFHRVSNCYWLTGNRIVWSIMNVIFFLRMVTDWRHGPVMREFSRQRWRTLAKLNFPMIFVHWMCIVTFLNSVTTMPIFTLWQVLASSTLVALGSLPIATLVHVMFENPIDKLIKREIFGFLQ